MKTSYLKSYHSLVFTLIVFMAQVNLFVQTLFMGRRAKVRFMHQLLLQHSRARR